MNFVVDLVRTNFDAVIAAPYAFAILLCVAVFVAYRLAAWHQAGEARNLKNEKIKLEATIRELEQPTAIPKQALTQITESANANASNPSGTPHVLYMKRQHIHWAPHNDAVSRRFWAAGTSLVGVVERDLVAHYKSRGIDDIRIILPSTELDTLAFHQLHQFDLQPGANLVHNQVDAARESFGKLSHRLSKLVSVEESKYLRRYRGVMYANITIFDDDAFLSPYDTTGLGDANPTLHFNSRTSPEGYRLAEEEFLRMWDAQPTIGLLPSKKKGCSMIFINSSDRVLLYLRDNKSGIPYPGRWDLLGGHVEEDELPEICIARELREEIEYSLLHPTLFRVFDLPDRLEFTYWRSQDLDISKTPLHEGQRLQWFSESEILALPPNQVAFGFKSVIELFYQERRSVDS